jgi:hypothetical protein
MLVALLMLLMLDGPKVIPCVVTTPSRVSCVMDERTSAKGTELILKTYEVDWANFPEWSVVKEGPHARERLEQPKLGQLLKAELEGGKVFPIVSCQVRIYRQVQQWANAHPEERVPFMMWTPPEDCTEPSGAVKALMRSVAHAN